MRQDKYADLIDIYDFDLITGAARFTGPDSIEVDGRPMKAFRYLIATGADAWVPPIDGLDDTGYLTSTEALELDAVPNEMIVVGANATGLEIGQLFTHLGSTVTYVEALDRIAPFEEPEVSETLHAYLEKQGAMIHTAANATKAGRDDHRVWLEIENGEITKRLEADTLLMATGRRARTADLGLDAAGVDTDVRGHVVVDDQLQTSNPSVFAAGDVTAHPQFVYVAAKGGNIAA